MAEDSRFIVTKTPLRVSLFGGGSDLPSYYEEAGRGAVLSFAIDRATYVTLKHHTVFFDERYRLNYFVSETTSTIGEIRNNIARESLRFTGVDEPLYISTISDLPSGNGLGSSSSFCVGLLRALHLLKGDNVSALELGEQACEVEINRVGSPIGKQDQYACALGGVNRIEFLASGTVIAARVPHALATLNRLLDAFVLVWTGTSRDANLILGDQSAQNGSARNRDFLGRMVALVDQAFGLFCANAMDAKTLGAMLHESWQLKRELAGSVSSSSIDGLYEEALQWGAYGGKLLGAGGGGFLLMVFPPERRAAYEKMISVRLKVLDFAPTDLGSQVVCNLEKRS